MHEYRLDDNENEIQVLINIYIKQTLLFDEK